MRVLSFPSPSGWRRDFEAAFTTIHDVPVRVENADSWHIAGSQPLLPARLPQHVFGPEDGRRRVIGSLQ